MSRAATILALIYCLFPGRSDACSIVVLPHTIDEAEQRVDTRPPDRVAGEVGSITRGQGPTRRPDGVIAVSSCDDIGSIEVVLTHFRDDRTPTAKLGYRVTLVDGTLPERFRAEDGVFVPAPESDPRFFLHWIDGAHDDQELFDFTFVVTAVDLAGNESAPSAPIRASHPGTSTR